MFSGGLCTILVRSPLEHEGSRTLKHSQERLHFGCAMYEATGFVLVGGWQLIEPRSHSNPMTKSCSKFVQRTEVASQSLYPYSLPSFYFDRGS